METWWRCLVCEDKGQGDKPAEKHTRDTQHATTTWMSPPVRGERVTAPRPRPRR